MSTSNDSNDKKIVEEFLGNNFKSINEDLTLNNKHIAIRYRTYGEKGVVFGISLYLRTPLITALEESINSRVPKERRERLINNIIPALIRSGADVNKISAGISPLALAIVLGEFSIVKQLIDSGADINLPLDKKKLYMWGYLRQLPHELSNDSNVISAAQLVDLAWNKSPQKTGILKMLGTTRKGVRWADEEDHSLNNIRFYDKKSIPQDSKIEIDSLKSHYQPKSILKNKPVEEKQKQEVKMSREKENAKPQTLMPAYRSVNTSPSSSLKGSSRPSSKMTKVSAKTIPKGSPSSSLKGRSKTSPTGSPKTSPRTSSSTSSKGIPKKGPKPSPKSRPVTTPRKP